MNLLSKACIVLLSSNASVAFGSTGSEKEHGKEQSGRNLGLRGGEMKGDGVSDEVINERISNLFDDVDDEMYDLVAMSYNRLSDEINCELLDVNPGLDKEGLAYARDVCLDFLQDDNDTLNDTIDDTKDEAEDEVTFDSLQVSEPVWPLNVWQNPLVVSVGWKDSSQPPFLFSKLVILNKFL